MTLPPLLLDTCVVLSLYASQHIEEILQANQGPFLIAEAVRREALYIHVVVDGIREREPISLEPLIESGILAVVEPESEDELQSLIDYSLKLDEGEAMTCALALHRGYRIATDERKTINLIGHQVDIVGTLDLVQAWETTAAVAHAVMQEVLAAIEDRGYVPGATHRHYEWWKRLR
jgi:predicted nucleic acid-binding protein